MASLTQWAWVWVNSGNWWWTRRPGVLRFMGLQRVRHDWVTELNWTDSNPWASLVARLVKNLPEMQETLVRLLGWEDSPGEGIGYPLQYSWVSLVAQTIKNLSAKNLSAMQETWVGKIPWKRAWQPMPVFLPREPPWTEKPGGLWSAGLQRVGHDWATSNTASTY